MRTTTGDGRFCASGFTSALTTTFNLTLTGCGFGGAEAQAASRQEAANKNAIGIARNVRIVSLRQWLLIRIFRHLRSARFKVLSRTSCSSYALANSSPNKLRKLESA